MSVIAEMVKNVVETPFEAFDATIVERARDRVIDALGCLIAGSRASGCSMIGDLIREWGGKKESTILVQGGKVPAHNAALVNSVMTRSYDFEPTGAYVEGKSTPAHLSGTTVPTAITVAEQHSADGKELLTALILGDDLASRIIAASNLNIDSGFDCTGTINAFGAAAIAGRIARLKEYEMLHAFGIVLNQFAGSFQNIFDGVHSFKLPQGLSAQAGIFSTALAAKGFTGIRDPLLSKYGYFSLYCKSYQLEVLTRRLGEEFYADYTCKPYPCCRSNHAAIDCVLELNKTNHIDPDDIDEIVVDITPTAHDFAVGQPFKIRDVPQIDAAFNLQYTVANALLRKDVKLEHFAEELVRDPSIADLINKIRLTATIPSSKPLGAKVIIRMKQGIELIREVDMPRGNGILTPLASAEIRKKFLDNVAFSGTISLENGEKVLSLLERLEEVNDVNEIISLLVPRQ
ncbi:MAG TPA: MmgE/PrpD family protein [Syntrophorhabdaceae bacterium]|nr:MmgE/PrpD family protein [Syntrophorhabdaceae bacterium]